jgi:uncharacterized membrane protein YbhN (UPF0104 family)
MARSRAATIAWRAVRIAVALGLLGWLVSQAGLGDLSWSAVQWGWLLLAVVLVPFSLAIRAWSFGLVLNCERAILGPWALYRLTLVGAGLGLFLPTGAADLAKARWGLVAHGAAEEMVVSSVIDKLTSLVGAGLLGLIAAIVAGDPVLAVVSATLTVGGALPMFVRWDAAWHFLVRVLAAGRDVDVERVARHARPPVSLVAAMTGVSVLGWVVTYSIMFACARTVGADVGVSTVLALAPLVTVSRLVPISFGGLGLGEVTMTALLVRAGVPQSVAAQSALAQMAVLVLLPGAAGMVLLGLGTNRGDRDATHA